MNKYTKGIKDGLKLFFLSKIEAHEYRLYHATQRRIHRQHWLAQIKELAENGEIVLATYGIDCDGCAGASYYTVKASAKAIDELILHCDRWADGAMSYSLQAPSQPRPRRFRDYGLEAFENGHAHCLHI